MVFYSGKSEVIYCNAVDNWKTTMFSSHRYKCGWSQSGPLVTM